MKALVLISGIKILSKNDQRSIDGGGWTHPCQQRGQQCCERTGSYLECAPGQCFQNSFCLWS
ncbi:hypothetical protein [Aquimarina rhabdastrellae]